MPEENEVVYVNMDSDTVLAMEMYQAYGKSTDFKNFQGNPMPAWQDLPEGIQKAWIAAGKKARKMVVNETIKVVLNNIFKGTF